MFRITGEWMTPWLSSLPCGSGHPPIRGGVRGRLDGPAADARLLRSGESSGAAEILDADTAKLDVEDEVRGRLVVAVGDGLGHGADPGEGCPVGNDRMAPGAVVRCLPPGPHAHLRGVAGSGDRPADPGPVAADGQARHRAAEGGFLPCLPQVITPPAAHGAV